MKRTKALLVATLIIIFSMLTLVWFFPPNGDFRVENPFWNGLSTLDAKEKATTITAFSDLPANPKGTALLLVPYEQFSDAELAQLKSYVSNGGTLVLLDDYGYGNQILESVGLNLRFTGEPMLDPLFCYRNKAIPKITDFEQTPITANISSVVLNHATCLNNTANATVIASSSSFSFLDANDDGSWDSSELNGPFPVAAYEKVDEGYVVAVADPSLMINGMIGLDDNVQFVNSIASIGASNPQIFVDQSHLPGTPLDAAKAGLDVIYNSVCSPLGTLTLIAVILVISLNSIWRRGGKVVEKH
jgi:hypothetical protein